MSWSDQGPEILKKMEEKRMLELEGVIPATITPFTKEGAIDEQALRDEVRYLIDVAKVHGLTVTGSTGEGYMLETEEIRRVTELTLDEARGAVPVITGLIVNSTHQAIEGAKAVQDLPITALQVTPVHYVFDPGADGHVLYFQRIAQETGLPIVIYNVVPWLNLSASLLTRIVNEVDLVQGIKQSGRDLHKVAQLVESLDGKAKVYSAVDDLLYSSFCLGADGTISALPTVVPELCVQLWDAVKTGNHTLGLELHRRMLKVWNVIDAPDMPARIKEAIRLQGRSAGYCRSPFLPVKSEVSAEIRQALQEAEVPLA
jgi:4-hydroxy-tetrahydrodipicolinate synthase